MSGAKMTETEGSTTGDLEASGSSSPREESIAPFLDNRIVGRVFLAFIGVLGGCIAFAFVYFVVVSMSSPSYLHDYVMGRPDVPAQLTVTLDYESRAMKTMGVQIAFAFLVGLVFAGIGVLLFAVGANGSMQLKSSAKWLPVSLSATAPGLAVLTLGGIIIALAVSKDVRRNMIAEMNLPGTSERKERDEEKRVSTKPHPGSETPRAEPD